MKVSFFWFYPFSGDLILSWPACREDVWEGSKIHCIRELQQREVMVCDVRVVVWVIYPPGMKILGKIKSRCLYLLYSLSHFHSNVKIAF